MESFWDKVKIWFAFWTNTTKWFVTVRRHGCWCQCRGESQGELCCGWVVIGLFHDNTLGLCQTIEKPIKWWLAVKTKLSRVSHYLERPLANFLAIWDVPNSCDCWFSISGSGNAGTLECCVAKTGFIFSQIFPSPVLGCLGDKNYHTTTTPTVDDLQFSWNNKPIIFGNDVFLSWMKHDKFLIWIHFELIFKEDQLKIKLTNWKFPPNSGWTLVLIFAVRLVVGAWDYKCERQIQMSLDTKIIHQTFEPLVSNAAMENLHFSNKKNISTSFCLVSFYLIPFHRWYHSTNISETFPSVCVPMIRLDHVWHET